MRFLGIVLVLAVVGGCAKKTETQQKKEMSKEPVAVRAQQEAAEPVVPLEGPYLAVVSFDFGKSRAELSAVDDEIRKASPADYPQIEAKLIAVLRNQQATVAGKQFACRMLERVGSKRSVPVLAGMLVVTIVNRVRGGLKEGNLHE